MIRVLVTNNVTAKKYSSDFQAQGDADTWINLCVSTNSWGKPERWIADRDLSLKGEDKSRADESKPAGGPDEEMMLYHFPCEYSITQSDVSEEYAKSAEIQKALKCQSVGCEVLAMVKVINLKKSLSDEQLMAALTDPTLTMIERLLWLGSLVKARALIQGYSGAHFSSEDIAQLLEIIDSSGAL